jgi:hypothetical protein
VLKLGHVLFGSGLLGERPRQHELGLEHGFGVLYNPVEGCRHPRNCRVLAEALYVADAPTRVALVPGSIELFGCSPAQSRHGDARGLEVSPGGLLQNELVQRQIRDGLAQPAVLELKVLQALHLSKRLPSIESLQAAARSQSCACSSSVQVARRRSSANELNTMLTPHSFIPGDARFAYFN